MFWPTYEDRLDDAPQVAWFVLCIQCMIAININDDRCELNIVILAS